MHQYHHHSINPPNHCTLANKHFSPTASPTPIHRPSVPPAPQPQQPHNTPRVCPTSPRVASPILQPKIKFTLAASLRVEAPTFIVHQTHSHTTADSIFPLATPSQSHTSLFLPQVPYSAIRHPCPCLKPQIPICLHYPLGFLSLHQQHSSISLV